MKTNAKVLLGWGCLLAGSIAMLGVGLGLVAYTGVYALVRIVG